MTPKPRLAVAFPLPLERVHLGKDVGLIPDGLRGRGWDVEMHCVGHDGSDWPFPVHVATRGQLSEPAYWAGRGLDGAIVFTFATQGDISAALRSSGVRVIGKGDTEGRLSPRAHPRETLRESVWHEGSPAQRVRSLASWAARAGPLHAAEMRAVREAVAHSDAFVVETEPARRRIARLLEHHGAPELAGRLHTVLNPVTPVFTRGELPAERERLVVAVGSWDLPAKNARLLARALGAFLDAHPDHRAQVVGRAADTRFRNRHGGRLEATPHVGQGELAPLLARARIFVSSSRWESFSMAAHEGLASGCTVVGPRLTPFRQAVELGAYGTLQDERGAAGLAGALSREAREWETGARDARAIAAFWRGLLDVDLVAERYEALLGGNDSPAGRAGRSSTSS